tara:strand:- start:510 stop:734 length:225 start_codon:yes stop_codon:yes gene_type:complete
MEDGILTWDTTKTSRFAEMDFKIAIFLRRIFSFVGVLQWQRMLTRFFIFYGYVKKGVIAFNYEKKHFQLVEIIF